jgi:hypothetical protein
MTAKNFNIKNGLSIGGVEVIDSSGNIAAGGVGAAVQEAIADKIGSIIQGSGSTTVTYDDDADTITISSTGKTEEEIQDIIGAALATNGTHTGLSVAYDDAGDGAIDITVSLSSFNTDALSEGSTNQYFTNARADARVQAAIDTDTTFASSSDTLVPSQLAVKTYVDAQVDTVDALSELTGTSDDITEGSTNVFFTNARADARISNAILDSDTFTGALSTNVPSAESTKAYVDAQTTDETAEGSSNLYFTDARVMTSLATVDTHIVPTTDVTYDLGSTSKQWRDIYVGPGSLYVNGQQVVSDNSGTITVSADADQNVSVQTSGSGDIELDATGTGNIQIKAPMQIQASNAISSSDGNAIQFSNSIDVDAIESRSTDTNLVLTGNGTGNVTLNDDVAITGNLTVSGTTTTVNSETISLADNIIALNSNFTSGSPTEDTGISVTRGGSAAKTLLWDETNDKWTVGSETFVAATFEGALTGNVTGTVSGNAGSATILETARTISLGGDLSGSASFNGSADISISATIADDSHNHVISNVDGLQTALDTKYESGDNVSLGTIASGAITITNATNAGGTARNMYQSTSAPASGDGAVGDMWILYS